MITAPRFGFAAVLLLAAGRSQRMGQPKLLLPWGPRSILGHLVDEWRQVGVGQITVVCAADDVLLQQELDRWNVPGEDRVFNPAPEQGMFSSVQCAARWNRWPKEITHIVVALGDQPHLRRQTLEALLEFSGGRPDAVCQPLFAGHRRHPVVLPRQRLMAAAQSSAADLKAFLTSIEGEAAGIDLDDGGLALDIDRPEDYREALRKFSPP